MLKIKQLYWYFKNLIDSVKQHRRDQKVRRDRRIHHNELMEQLATRAARSHYGFESFLKVRAQPQSRGAPYQPPPIVSDLGLDGKSRGPYDQ